MNMRKESGMSLFELLVAFGLFVGVATWMSSLLVVSTEAYGTGMKVASLEGDVRRALDRAAEALMGASAATMTPPPDPPFGAGSIVFRRMLGFNPAGPILGSLEQLEVLDDPSDPNDGADNDGDGAIDEFELVLTRTVNGLQSREVLIGNVARLLEGETANGLDDNGNGLIDEEGFALLLEGSVLTLRLTVEEIGRAHV